MGIVFCGLAVIFFLTKTVYPQECASDGSCDTHERCPIWKDEGECYRDPLYMREHCPVSCSDMKSSVPRKNECADAHNNCSLWAKEAECETNDSVNKYCKLSCGRCKKANYNNNNIKNNHQYKKDLLSNKEQEILCEDGHQKCAGWASIGECDENPNYMLSNCKKSCGVCTDEVEMKSSTTTNSKDIDRILQKTANFGDVQVAKGETKEKTIQSVREMIHYMEKSDDFLDLPQQIQKNCKNKNSLCNFWAVIGECEANMAFMKIQCAPACKTCHLIDIANRCPKLPDAIPALDRGELNKMFRKIVETAPGNKTLSEEERRNLEKSEMTNYTVTIHSRPSNESITEINIGNDKKGPPWVITFDNFLTEEEADSMIQAGYDQGYKRSEDVGSKNFDGTVNSKQSIGRTSENAWCSSRSGCREKTVPTRVLNRISSVTGIPAANSEDFQILKYDVNQFYNTHHDYIPHQRERQCGPRILTFYLYLSDVEAGGGTNFPDLDITVMPKKGRALLWPSIMNSKPMQIDGRTRHQALPVEKGLKFGANAWIHMFDYQAPQAIGCN